MNDELKKADPVGEREGEFEKWWKSPAVGDGPLDAESTAHAAWNAALASKQSAEGIPEIVVPEEKNDWSDEHWRMYESGRAGMLRAYDADNVAWDKYDHQILRLQMKIEAAQAIVSAKDAEIAHRCTEIITLNEALDNSRMEIAALKLSSARIEEETLRKAMKEICSYCRESVENAASHRVGTYYSPCRPVAGIGYRHTWFDDGEPVEDIFCPAGSILALIPTSPNTEPLKYIWTGEGPEPICTCGNPITKCTRMHDDHYPPRRDSIPTSPESQEGGE